MTMKVKMMIFGLIVLRVSSSSVSAAVDRCCKNVSLYGGGALLSNQRPCLADDLIGRVSAGPV